MISKVVTDDGSALKELGDLCEWADEIRLCYAWATSKGGKAAHWRCLDTTKLTKAVIGVHFAQTEPAALWELSRLGVLQVVADARGVALGVATRLMCVKRPDFFVVVNNANDESVRRIFGSRPRTPKTYITMMRTIRDMAWWSEPLPADPRESRI